MQISMIDRIDFINKYFKSDIKYSSSTDGINTVILKNNDRIAIGDTTCISYYKIGDVQETCDVSVEYRDFILNALIQRGDRNESVLYCMSCLRAIDHEQAELHAKLSEKNLGRMDRVAYMDRLNEVSEQKSRCERLVCGQPVYEF